MCSKRWGALLGKLTISSGETKTNYRSICFYYHGHKCLVCDEELFLNAHHINGNKQDNRPKNLKYLALLVTRVELRVASP